MNIHWLEQTFADVPAGNDWLSAQEAAFLGRLRFPKRYDDWRLGRWTAKCAAASRLNLPADALSGIEVRPAPSGAPDIFLHGEPATVTISISHRAGVALCAIAELGARIGCDLEIVEPRTKAFVSDYFTSQEQELVQSATPEDEELVANLIWSAKESALKALQAGLRLDTRSVVVNLKRWSVRNQEWKPLQLCCESDKTFHGWWRESENMIRTVVASSLIEPPIEMVSTMRTMVTTTNGD
jgi:4'-phosphopantetheinyl transferase